MFSIQPLVILTIARFILLRSSSYLLQLTRIYPTIKCALILCSSSSVAIYASL